VVSSVATIGHPFWEVMTMILVDGTAQRDEASRRMLAGTCLNFLMMIVNVSIHYSLINPSLSTGGPSRINKVKVGIPSHNEHVPLLSGSLPPVSNFDLSRPRGNDARGSQRIEIFLLLPSSLNSGGSSRRGGMSKAHLAAGSPLHDWNFNLLH